MSRVVTAPEVYKKEHDKEIGVFLAGAIDMGAAVDWQAYVIQQLADDEHFVLVNPRRKEFTPDTLDEQIWWELDALHDVNKIFLWFPKDAKAPISFFEAGLYWRAGSKLIVGAEQGFYRRRNLEISAKWYVLFLHDTLETMIADLRGVFP